MYGSVPKCKDGLGIQINVITVLKFTYVMVAQLQITSRYIDCILPV